MAFEISTALQTHNEIIGDIIDLGGDAVFATTPAAKLPEVIACEGDEFTDYSIGRFLSPHDEYVGSGKEGVLFTPEISIALTNQSQPVDALTIVAGCEPFKLRTEDVIGLRQIPKGVPIRVVNYRVGRHSTPHTIGQGRILAAGRLGGRRERGDIVETAGRAIHMVCSTLGRLGLQAA